MTYGLFWKAYKKKKTSVIISQNVILVAKK